MSRERINADIVIIGAGIAGLSVAFRALRLGLSVVVLDNGREGTSYAATGIIAPRCDYLLQDIDLVRIADRECRRFRRIFPTVIKPKRFLIPVDPSKRWMFRGMRELLKQYDNITPCRRDSMPPTTLISQGTLERDEPFIKKNCFGGAWALWEFTTDPRVLLFYIHRSNLEYKNYRRFTIRQNEFEFKEAGGGIIAVSAVRIDGSIVDIVSDEGLFMVNAAGPWIQDIVAPFGINLGVEFQLGIQMSVAGNFLNSGIISFDRNGTYCVFLPCGNHIQVGPTNTTYKDHPDHIHWHREGFDDLKKAFFSVMNPDTPKAGSWFMKAAGLRVKPKLGDTNRPVIWSHRRNGFNNFYTISPGKMSLALLAADELFSLIASQNGGYVVKSGDTPNVPRGRGIFLDGNLTTRNRIFLKTWKVKSLLRIGWNSATS